MMMDGGYISWNPSGLIGRQYVDQSEHYTWKSDIFLTGKNKLNDK